MSSPVVQYPLNFYRSSIVSKPLLVQSKDKSRIFIRLADEEQAGSLRHGFPKRHIAFGASIVNSARAEFKPHHLRKLLSERSSAIPPEIHAQLHALVSGKYPYILSTMETRPIVIWWRTWGRVEAKWAADLDFLNVPWAMTISKPPYRLKYLDSEMVEEDAIADYHFEPAAALPGDLADLLYLRGRSGQLAFPDENETAKLEDAIRRLWKPKLWGQSLPMEKSVKAVLEKRRGLNSSARLMLPHFVALSELLRAVGDLHAKPLRLQLDVHDIIDDIALGHSVMKNQCGPLGAFVDLSKKHYARGAVENPAQRLYRKLKQEFRFSA